MAAFSSAGQLRRRPAPVNTSMRRARSGIGVSSDIDMCRSSKPAPNVTPHVWLRKALPRQRLRRILRSQLYIQVGVTIVGANGELRAAADHVFVGDDIPVRHKEARPS